MVHIYNGILIAIKRNVFESCVYSREVDEPEPVIQSKVSQKEKIKIIY